MRLMPPTANRCWHVRVAGGLGNQIFQYGTALLLSKRLGGTVSLTDHTQRYEETRKLTLSAAVRLPDGLPSPLIRNAHALRLGRLPLPGCINDGTIAGALKRMNRSSQLLSHHLLDGYFQDCWRTDTVGDLVEAVKAVAHPVLPGTHVAMHIRGGDFLRLPDYHVATAEFYRDALRRLKPLVGGTPIVVEVITDDLPYARSVLPRESHDAFTFSYGVSGDLADDFNRLRAARARIIGNSTFSWWAAALATEPGLTLSCSKWTVNRTRAYLLPGEVNVA